MFIFPFTQSISEAMAESQLSGCCDSWPPSLSGYAVEDDTEHNNEIMLSRLEYNTMRKKIKHQWKKMLSGKVPKVLYRAVSCAARA